MCTHGEKGENRYHVIKGLSELIVVFGAQLCHNAADPSGAANHNHIMLLILVMMLITMLF